VIGALFVSSLAALGAAAQPPLFASVSTAHHGSVNAVGIAFVNSVSALGSFLGPFIVGSLMDGPNGLSVACLLAGSVMAAGGVLAILGPVRSPVLLEPLPESAQAN
jgi:MFS family permease